MRKGVHGGGLVWCVVCALQDRHVCGHWSCDRASTVVFFSLPIPCSTAYASLAGSVHW